MTDNDVIKTFGADRRANLLGLGVYALHTAVRLATERLLDKLQLGVCQLQLATIVRWAAKDEVLASHLHALLYPLYSL